MKKIILATSIMFLLTACGQKDEDTKPTDNTAPSIAKDDLPEISGTMSDAELAGAMGKAYLDENKNMPGVKTTPSGLQIQVLASGNEAGPHPTPGQIVCVHYSGKFITGNEFDSSYSRGLPTAFPSNGVIMGWVEALSMMRAGDKWKLVIPSDLGYGARGTPGGPIGPNETLVFDVELLKLLDISMDEYRTTYGQDMTLDCSKD